MCWILLSSVGIPKQEAWSTSSEPQSMSPATTIHPTLQTPWNYPPPSPRIDVLQLIEEAVEGSWIGHRARLFTQQQESEIGSLYAPPRQDGSGKKLVEIVIEMGDREEVSLTVRAPFFLTISQSMGAYVPI